MIKYQNKYWRQKETLRSYCSNCNKPVNSSEHCGYKIWETKKCKNVKKSDIYIVDGCYGCGPILP